MWKETSQEEFLPIGHHEQIKQKLKSERQQEYRKHLREVYFKINCQYICFGFLLILYLKAYLHFKCLKLLEYQKQKTETNLCAVFEHLFC